MDSLLVPVRLGVPMPEITKDDATVALFGRSDKAVTSLLSVARFQTVRANAQGQQRIAVATCWRRSAVKVKAVLSEQWVEFGKVGDKPVGKQSQIAHRHAVAA